MSDPHQEQPGDFHRNDEAASRILDLRDAANEQFSRLYMKAADHEGQLKKFDIVVTSLQSTIQSWSNAMMAVGALIIAVLAIFAAYGVYITQKIDGQIDKTNEQFNTTNTKVDNLASEVRGLPAAVSQQMLAVAASIANIRQQPVEPPRNAPKGARH